jgi:hypothetical protein
MKRISAILDGNSNAVIGLNYSDYIDHRVLAANAAEVHTVPSGAKYVLFSSTAPFFAKMGGAASIPVADVTNGAGCMYSPELIAIEGAATIGLISSSACTVTMEFYS